MTNLQVVQAELKARLWEAAQGSHSSSDGTQPRKKLTSHCFQTDAAQGDSVQKCLFVSVGLSFLLCKDCIWCPTPCHGKERLNVIR